MHMYIPNIEVYINFLSFFLSRPMGVRKSENETKRNGRVGVGGEERKERRGERVGEGVGR